MRNKILVDKEQYPVHKEKSGTLKNVNKNQFI